MNTKRTFLSFLASALLLLPLFGQDITWDADIKIEDLSASSIGLHGSGAGNQVRLVAPDYSDISGARTVSWTEGLDIQCYNENGSGTGSYRAATFVNGQSGYQDIYYPYLQVEAEVGTVITHIAFKGYNLTNAAGMTYGFSTEIGTDLTDNDFEILYYDLVPGILRLPDSPLSIDRGVSNACVLCTSVSGLEKLPVPEGIQTIRVAARTDFPGHASMVFINPVEAFHLLGIYIWTDQGIPSSVSSTQKETSFGSYIRDGALYFDREVAKVSVYSISGRQLIDSFNVTSLSLASLSSGVYLMKVFLGNGQQKLIKLTY
ncbi:MAG: T9SS type A sorting domain-containing protein [Candidatus Azobacteroides sp.]|nr:T9SS type A sorting domain-containing protein [Candidatus Azobacteroides sp.]